jgi:apolipoprotein N-acyltransferase
VTPLQHVGLALLAGVLVAASAPPFPVALVAGSWLGIALLACTLDRATVRGGVARGLAFGLAMNLVAMSFIPGTITRFTDVPAAAAIALWLLLSFGQATVWAICGGLTAFVSRRGVPLAIALPVGVAVATFSPQLFSWTLATPLARVPTFLQLAEVVGERGVAILVVVSAVHAAHAFGRERANRLRDATVAFAIPAMLLIYGMVRLPAIDAAREAAPHARIALVQQAIPPKDRWREELAPQILETLRALTRQAQQQGAELAIWPEAAYPYDMLPHDGAWDDGSIAPRIRAPGIDIDVLTGLLTLVPRDPGGDARAHDHYNAAALVTRDGRISAAAAKIELLAFGEAVPFGEQIPALRRLFARGGGLRPGKEVVILSTKGPGPIVRAGVLNCYEDTLPSVARRVVRASPNLLVNVTNDAWFGDTAEPELHLVAGIARAIETRRDVVRAVNTGVTAHVDATGRVVARAPRETRTILLVTPALLEGAPTPYVRFGDATWLVPLLGALVFVVVRLVRARRSA